MFYDYPIHDYLDQFLVRSAVDKLHYIVRIENENVSGVLLNIIDKIIELEEKIEDLEKIISQQKEA